jgi:hypothetical protein
MSSEMTTTKTTMSLISYIFIIFLFLVVPSLAHDHNKPNLDDWFGQLKSGKGLCCSGKDGTALSDVDWDTKAGHYRVRIDGEWWDVPDEAVVTEPNRDGATMVWPMRSWDSTKGTLVITIRCFMPGAEG